MNKCQKCSYKRKDKEGNLLCNKYMDLCKSAIIYCKKKNTKSSKK